MTNQSPSHPKQAVDNLPTSPSTSPPDQSPTAPIRKPGRTGRAGLRSSWFGRNLSLLLMAVPGLLFIVVFKYLTMFGILIAFKNYRTADGILGSEWVGLKNFAFLFGTDKIWLVTRNTVMLNLIFIVAGTIASLAIALLIFEIYNSALTRIYQTTLFFPQFISWIIASYFVFGFLSLDEGLINQLIVWAGGAPVAWYSSPQYWPAILTLVAVWKGAGAGSLLYLAGMLGIDPQQYEAARIDGASKWQEIRYITLPMLLPLITISILLAIGNILNADFGLFFSVTRNSAALYPTTDVIDTFVYRALLSLRNTGMASAAGLYQSVAGLILIVTANWLVRRVDPDRALF